MSNDETRRLPKIDPDEFVPVAVSNGETNEEFTARIVEMVESRMRVLALRD